MVKLSERLHFGTDEIAPIPFPEQKSIGWLDEHDGETVRVCGWGKNVTGG